MSALVHMSYDEGVPRSAELEQVGQTTVGALRYLNTLVGLPPARISTEVGQFLASSEDAGVVTRILCEGKTVAAQVQVHSDTEVSVSYYAREVLPS